MFSLVGAPSSKSEILHHHRASTFADETDRIAMPYNGSSLGGPLAKHSSHIMDMARKGAEHRYQELKEEIAALVKNFPHLGRSSRGDGRKKATADSTEATARVPRRRRKMSAAAKKAASQRMKKYWAAKRSAKNS